MDNWTLTFCRPAGQVVKRWALAHFMTATLDSNFRLARFMTATQAILVNFLINNFNFNFNLNLKNLDFNINFNLACFMTANLAILENFLLSNLNLFWPDFRLV